MMPAEAERGTRPTPPTFGSCDRPVGRRARRRGTLGWQQAAVGATVGEPCHMQVFVHGARRIWPGGRLVRRDLGGRPVELQEVGGTCRSDTGGAPPGYS